MMVELSKLNVNINLSGVFFWLPRVFSLFLVFSFIAGVLYTFGFGQEFLVGLMVWVSLFFTMLIAWKQRLKAPVVLATSEGAIGYAGMKYLYAIAQIAAQESKIPIALHLDHGGDMNVVRSAIRLGYSSVMIDASHEEFEKNVTLTRKIV